MSQLSERERSDFHDMNILKEFMITMLALWRTLEYFSMILNISKKAQERNNSITPNQKKYARIPQRNKITNKIHCSKINFNISSLNFLIKRHRLMNRIGKQDPSLYHLNKVWPMIDTPLYHERIEKSISMKWKYFSNLSSTSTLTPMSLEERHMHWWTERFWKMLVSSPGCIIILCSRSAFQEHIWYLAWGLLLFKGIHYSWQAQAFLFRLLRARTYGIQLAFLVALFQVGRWNHTCQ